VALQSWDPQTDFPSTESSIGAELNLDHGQLPPSKRIFIFIALQGMRQYSYALDAPGRRHRDFSELAKEEAFRNASTVYPVQTPEDFYRLHAYYSKVRFYDASKL